MFEKFVREKIDKEKSIINALDSLSTENIIASGLSEFDKNYILNGLEETTDKEELLSKIEKSNKLYFNYVTRPKWTLLNFLFSKFESRPPNEVIEKLKLFPFYKYYGDALTDYIKSNSLMFITKREAADIIDETNKAIYDKLMTDISNLKIKNFFLQIFYLKYDDEPEYNLESTIPYSFIKIFIEDKSFDELIKKFKVLEDLDEDSELSLKDIIKVFNDKYSATEKKEIISKEIKDLNVEMVSKILIDIPSEKEITETESANLYSEELLKASEETEIQDEETFDKQEPVEKNLVKELFNDRQLNKILDKVYNSDVIYREKSFDKLNGLKNWKDASRHLKEIFENNKVNIYNKDVIRFVDKLNEYYRGRE